MIKLDVNQCFHKITQQVIVYYLFCLKFKYVQPIELKLSFKCLIWTITINISNAILANNTRGVEKIWS